METFALEQLDFSEIQEAVDEILRQGFSFQDTVLALLSGEQPFTLEGFLGSVWLEAGQNLAQEKQLFLSILVLGIAAALLTNVTGVFQSDQIGEISFEMTYLLLFLLLLRVFEGAAELAGQVLAGVLQFMQALLPAWCLSVTLGGRGHDGAGFLSVFAGPYLSAGLAYGRSDAAGAEWYMVLVFVNHLTKEEYLSQLTELTGKAAGWIMKSLLGLVVGFHAVQGMVTPAVDALKGTAFTRAARLLPGIGNAAGGVAELLLGSAVLLKNGIGAAAVLVLGLLCLGPLLKAGNADAASEGDGGAAPAGLR